MRPIRDISDLRKNSVLYHSAFGFAQVGRIGRSAVEVRWERGGTNLPQRVSRENLLRVYSICEPDGFFSRALNEPDALAADLERKPASALAALLQDLAGPQRVEDIREWITSRGLMDADSFATWWEGLQSMLEGDSQFRWRNGVLSLQQRRDTRSPIELLASGSLTPSRRLDLALAHRASLSDDVFEKQVLLAWCTGSYQVRDLALAVLKALPPQKVLRGLLAMEPDNVEALIHAIRRSGWTPYQMGPEIQEALLLRVKRPANHGGPADAEGRLCAALLRWGAAGVVDTLTELSNRSAGHPVVHATLAALAPRRVQSLVLDLLDNALRTSSTASAQWLTRVLVEQLGQDQWEIAERLSITHPHISTWIQTQYHPDEDFVTEEVPHEVDDFDPLGSEPVPFADLPAQTGETVLSLGLELARALAQKHAERVVVNPTRTVTRLAIDGSVVFSDIGDPNVAMRIKSESPSPSADVYSAATVLIEAILGRPWPRHVTPDRVIPYIRGVAKNLPPSTIAMFDSALQPLLSDRVPDGAAWLAQWEAAASAERQRAATTFNEHAQWVLGYDSHIGRMKVLYTQTNQDALFLARRGSVGLLVVCDGISTANAGSGDVASAITTRVVTSLWEQSQDRLADADTKTIRDFLRHCLQMSNRAVCETALQIAGGSLLGRIPMGTTAVIGVTRGNHVTLAWLGDSRAYLVGSYGAGLLTADHNQAGERLVAWQGGMEASWDPAGFALVGYVGHFNEWARPDPLMPSYVSLTLLPGERLVMCSDGITDYIGDVHPEVSALLGRWAMTSTPDVAARSLVELANLGGGGDNATVIVASIESV